MRVTLVFTVLNEADSLPALLDSIAAQTRRPDEIVVCDGGSRDASVALLRGDRRLEIRVIEAPGANISRGRNLAIAAASHDVIACTDAGVRLDPRWLEAIVAPLTDERRHAVAGFFTPDPRTTFEVAMGATVLPELRDIRPETFLPSSRSVAFRKSAWAAVGGYPEWLDYCEDLIFDMALRERWGAFAFAPEAVAHFRPRGSLRAFFKQYYRYARGDGKANLFLERHLVRYATYLIALPALLAGLVGGAPMVKLLAAALLLAGAAAYTRAPYRRLRRLWSRLTWPERLKAVALVPIIRVVGDVAKMLGYPAGVGWRLQHRPGCRSHR
ncbi:MAG: glycosyltransferase [Chloroflexi bacterium]|jgi:glycosyltransferase involved in cell wall biosynthesis|uniref:Glycosyl transferase n=1 Tax=Candidatus Thermofonsia Clade 3 bacterium TaxID=2364212 RepID=A0A2M8QE84_9CHLR|nr:glycosyltransferase [Candidatus Roseilinea sp. NK_OTU-006]PJF48125.1 MAG: glycosyl transferase [Candidatus Thermofonsia Clade 3 bacterium]RMG62024.1 MAG: glycosyltransferase [Chloroflexota bacterium]